MYKGQFATLIFVCFVLWTSNLFAGLPDIAEVIKAYKLAARVADHSEYIVERLAKGTKSGHAIDATTRLPLEIDADGWAVFRIICRVDLPTKVDLITLGKSDSIPLIEANPNVAPFRNVVRDGLWQDLREPFDKFDGLASQSTAKQLKLSDDQLSINVLGYALNGGELLDGWIRGWDYKRIPEILSSGQNTIADEHPQQGNLNQLIHFTSVDGTRKLQVWLDQSVEYQPRRIIFESSEKGKELSLSADSIEYTVVEGHPLATAAAVHFYIKPIDTLYESRFVRRSITLRPKFDLTSAFKIQPPAGYSVSNFEDPTVPWSVKDGVFVRRIDRRVAESVDRLLAEKASSSTREAPRPPAQDSPQTAARVEVSDRYRYTTLGASVLLIAAIVALGTILYRRKEAKAHE